MHRGHLHAVGDVVPLRAVRDPIWEVLTRVVRTIGLHIGKYVSERVSMKQNLLQLIDI